MKNAARLLLLFFFSGMLTACAERDSLHAYNQPHVYQVDSWSPSKVKVVCPSADCPEGVGVVVFVQDTRWGFRIQRCTATAIAVDRLLTNSHCGKSLQYNRAYFFLPVGGQTRSIPVDARVYDREEGFGLESGMASDLAIFTLSEPILNIRPRRVARKIPNQMPALVAYMANDSSGSRFETFTIDKSVCSTIPRQVLFGGGAEEANIGLALFGCPIAQGNSGSPAFLPGNLEDIQVVINSHYPLSTEKAQPLINRLMVYFTEPPRHLQQNFGMGNRVHCMNLEGQPSAEALCAKVTFMDSLRSRFESGAATIAQRRLRELNTDSSVTWGLRVFPTRVYAPRGSTTQTVGKGMVMIPYPVCLRANTSLSEPEPQQTVQYLSLGLDQQGKLVGKVQRTMTLKTRILRTRNPSSFEVSVVQDFRVDRRQDLVTGMYVGEPEDHEAQRLLSPEVPTLIGRCTSDNLPPFMDYRPAFALEL